MSSRSTIKTSARTTPITRRSRSFRKRRSARNRFRPAVPSRYSDLSRATNGKPGVRLRFMSGNRPLDDPPGKRLEAITQVVGPTGRITQAGRPIRRVLPAVAAATVLPSFCDLSVLPGRYAAAQ